MKTILTAALLLTSSLAYAQCFGPGGCSPEPVIAGTAELCFPEGCQPVQYSRRGQFMLAESTLPNGYAVLGWAGPCMDTDCPDLLYQAAADLELNAKRANRAQRYEY